MAELRATRAVRASVDGTPLNVLQELGGWASAEVVQRYAHLATEHLSHWVDRSSGLRAVKSYHEFTTLKERATKVRAVQQRC